MGSCRGLVSEIKTLPLLGVFVLDCLQPVEGFLSISPQGARKIRCKIVDAQRNQPRFGSYILVSVQQIIYAHIGDCIAVASQMGTCKPSN